MLSNSSGQSAIEYLMTYGWMLLVVAITGSAVFATVGNQSVDSTSGFSGSDIMIENFGVSADDEISFNMRSASGSEVVVSRVNVSDPDTGNFIYKEFTGDNKLNVGGSKVFELPNVSRTDSSNELDVEIVYDSGSLSNLSVSGTVSGSLELTSSGSYEGLPADDHQSISDEGGEGGSLSLMQTVSYTYDGSGDVQVNESTAGSNGYQVDLNNDFSEPVEEIKIIEMQGADGSNTGYQGASGGFIANATADVSSYNGLDIWVGETSGTFAGGWGRSLGGDGGSDIDGEGGGGGGSTEILTQSGQLVAKAAGGGGSEDVYGNKEYGGGGGALGGIGGTTSIGPDGSDAEGAGEGGDGKAPADSDQHDGGQELGIGSLDSDGQTTTGGSNDGSGKIVIEYYG